MNNATVKRTTIVIWIIVVTTIILYYRFFYFFHSITDIVIAIIPTIVFMTGALLAIDRDQYRVKMAKKNDEYNVQKQLNWGMASKHDALTYLIPSLILTLPLFVGELPDLIDISQAILAFAALSFTKYIYWGEL